MNEIDLRELTPKELNEEISKLEKQIKIINDIKNEIKNLTDAQKLANILHKKKCKHNHTDGCGWYYESWENPGFCRKEWLGKAEKLLETGNTMEQIIRIVDLM